ncbi:MAG: hypothetical protein ABJA67_16260 [Chthonomonadales bacterium]
MGKCDGQCVSIKWDFVKTVKGPTAGPTTPQGNPNPDTPAVQKQKFEDGCKAWAADNGSDVDCKEKGCDCSNDNPIVHVTKVVINQSVMTTEFDKKGNPTTYTLTGDAEFTKTRTIKECYPPKIAMDRRTRDLEAYAVVAHKRQKDMG